MRLFPVFFVFFFCFFIGDIYSQDTVQIDINAAEQQFVNENLSLLAAKYNIEIARSNVLQARLWYNPNIYLNGPLYNQKTKKTFDYNAQTDFQFQQLFSLAGKHSNMVKLAKIDQQKSEIIFNEIVRSLQLELYSNLDEIFELQQKIKLYTSQINSLQQVIVAAEQQYKLGAISGNEVIRLKTELQNSKNDLAQTDISFQEAQKNIKILLNYDYQTTVEVVMAELPKSNVESLDKVVSLAEANRPDYLLAQQEVEYQARNLKLQKSYRIPDLAITTEYDKGSNFQPEYYGLGLGIPLPLFNRNQGLIHIAKAQYKQAQILDTLARKTVDNEVIGAYITLNKIRSQIDKLDPNYNKQLEELIKNAYDNYSKRYISLLEFLDQLRTYADARLSLIELNSDYLNAIHKLNFTMGFDYLKL